MPFQPDFNFWEQKEITVTEIWRVRRVGYDESKIAEQAGNKFMYAIET